MRMIEIDGQRIRELSRSEFNALHDNLDGKIFNVTVDPANNAAIGFDRRSIRNPEWDVILLPGYEQNFDLSQYFDAEYPDGVHAQGVEYVDFTGPLFLALWPWCRGALSDLCSIMYRE